MIPTPIASNFRSQALSDAELQLEARSIFATAPMNGLSHRYKMDHQRLFIANLSKGKLGHDKANLLGSLLVTQFQLAAMARTNQPEHERRDF